MHILHFLRDLISQYGLVGMYVSVGIENLGIPLPTEPAYLVGESLIRQGVHSWFVVQFVLYLGHISGAMASYYAGRRLARTMKDRGSLTETQHRIAGWFDKYGYLTVFATRLIGYVRPWSSYVAGIAEVPPVPFFLLSSAGTIILNLICLAFARQFLWLWTNYPIARILITFSCMIGFIFIAIQAGKRRRKKSAVSEG